MHTQVFCLDDLSLLLGMLTPFNLSICLAEGSKEGRSWLSGGHSGHRLSQRGCGRQDLVEFLDQGEIQGDLANGKDWVVPAFDTTPGYLDMTPFPAALTKWKSRAIYRVDDHQVGQWNVGC